MCHLKYLLLSLNRKSFLAPDLKQGFSNGGNLSISNTLDMLILKQVDWFEDLTLRTFSREPQIGRGKGLAKLG